MQADQFIDSKTGAMSRLVRNVPIAIPLALLFGLLILLVENSSLWRVAYWVTEQTVWIALVVIGGMALSFFVTKGARRVVTLLLGVVSIIALLRAWDQLLPW